MIQKIPTKGWICLDIDGTITKDILSVPQPVLEYLKELQAKEWKLVFVTGRTFSLAEKPLKNFEVPYHLIAQNGASCFEMPDCKIEFKKYLSMNVFHELEEVIHHFEHDVVLFTGVDQGEEIYYRPQKLKGSILNYFETKLVSLAGRWKAVESFKSLKVQEIPYGKIYGQRKELEQIHQTLKSVPLIQTHLVEDSVNPKWSILQIMHQEVDKGKAVLKLMDQLTIPRPIISAGNDLNDEALLQIADVRIAMTGSPKELTDQAHIIAPRVDEMGILPALKLAIEQAERL